MYEDGKKSKWLVVLFWIATIGCFIFGYYNTHLGLRTFRAFGSGYGSWFLAAIPLVMVLGGFIAAVNGNRKMIYLYLTGELIFFVFNMTYLYPTYLGRTLVHEETKELKDSVNVYKNRLDKLVSVEGSGSYQVYQRLKEIQVNLLTEIRDRNGFGEYATRQLNEFNRLAGTNYTPERVKGDTEEEREKYYRRWKENTDNGIKDFLIKNNDGNTKLVLSKYDMDDIDAQYSGKLETILEDNSDVSIKHEDVMNNSQILLLKEVTTKLDKIAADVNSVKKPEPFHLIVTGDETIAFPTTQKLGKFEHTMISVSERLGKLDTWGIIIVCFFFDLLGPFLFYFYLRKDEDEDVDFGNDSGWDTPWWKRLFGIQ